MEQVTIDYVSRAPALFQWRMVLVEEGPWPDSAIENNLLRIQDRLYACIDAALDGNLARQFPDSMGRQLVIHLDCYNVPGIAMRTFFERFTQGIRTLPDYKNAFGHNEFIRDLSFELTCAYTPQFEIGFKN